MNDWERGQSIERRARAMAIYSAREFERMSEVVSRKVPRQRYSEAIAGEASDTMFARIEDALSLMEERTSHDEPDNNHNGPLRMTLHNVYGIGEIIAEGGTPEEVSEMVMRLVRQVREEGGEGVVSPRPE